MPPSSDREKTVLRALAYVYRQAGDLPLNEYRRRHANEVVSAMAGDGLKKASIQRYVNAIKAAFNYGIAEEEIDATSVFAKVSIPVDAGSSEERPPFSVEEIKAIQTACRIADDPRRWLISLISDTGCRLAEIVGLRISDIRLSSVPHLVIETHDARRTKTETSKRLVPLVGQALWAAQRVAEAQRAGQVFAFPDYVKNGRADAKTPSATLNKWLREHCPTDSGKTLHSFRHAMRDRLRNVGAPQEIQDRVGGWVTPGVGSRYGRGPELQVLRDWMLKIDICLDLSPRDTAKSALRSLSSSAEAAGERSALRFLDHVMRK